MATKAKPKDKSTPDAPVEITGETYTKIFDACAGNPALGIPTLIGGTQRGKTHFVREWSRARNRTLVPVNAQNDEKEDTVGYAVTGDPLVGYVRNVAEVLTQAGPALAKMDLAKLAALVAGIPMPAQRTVQFTNPPMFHDDVLAGKPTTLFLDEEDKARPDVLSTHLALLCERRLRWTHLSPETFICVAMNEPKAPLPDPLVARLLFLAWPPSPAVVIQSAADAVRPLAKMLFSSMDCNVRFPLTEATPGALYKLTDWMNTEVFWEPDVKLAVVRGLFPSAQATAALAWLADRPVGHGVTWAKTVRPQHLTEGFAAVMNAADRDTKIQIIQTLVEREAADATKEFGAALKAILEHNELLAEVGPPLEPKK